LATPNPNPKNKIR